MESQKVLEEEKTILKRVQDRLLVIKDRALGLEIEDLYTVLEGGIIVKENI